MEEHVNFPSTVIRRHVQWPDTDATGHHHHSVIIRWVEEAEADLLYSIGLASLFGHAPRVHYEVDYRRRLWFWDEVQVRLVIASVGRSSLTYHFEVDGPHGRAAVGRMVVVNTEGNAGRASEWPESLRAALVGIHVGNNSSDT